MPNGHLNFTMENLGVRETSYEPISRLGSHESLWIGEILGNLGCNSTDWFSKVRELNNRMRVLHHTNWAYTIFIVEDRNDTDGSFSDESVGHSSYGGPVVVLPADVGGWGIDRLDQVVAHETGHIFYATDEYGMEGESSGYLDVKEMDNSGCLMDTASWRLSEGTVGQVGWLDSNGNGLMDHEDTIPRVTMDNPAQLTNTTFQITGLARDVPIPNRNPKSYTGNDVNINIIVVLQYQIGFGSWISVSPADQILDEAEEAFQFTVGPLAPGSHSILVRAENSVGNWGIFTTTLRVTTGTAQPPTPGEGNYNPLVAAALAIVLAIVGLWFSRRRPWKGGKDGMAVAKTFTITSLPFVLAEAATGIASILTGELSIPPMAGSGTVADIGILAAGLGIALAAALGKKPSRVEAAD